MELLKHINKLSFNNDINLMNNVLVDDMYFMQSKREKIPPFLSGTIDADYFRRIRKYTIEIKVTDYDIYLVEQYNQFRIGIKNINDIYITARLVNILNKEYKDGHTFIILIADDLKEFYSWNY